jgi:hypothetical protein
MHECAGFEGYASHSGNADRILIVAAGYRNYEVPDDEGWEARRDHFPDASAFAC